MDQSEEVNDTIRFIETVTVSVKAFLALFTTVYLRLKHNPRRKKSLSNTRTQYNLRSRISQTLEHTRRITTENDLTCLHHLRMSCDSFSRLCYLLENLGGLRDSRHVTISEQVAIFLSILSHHKKNRVVKYDFNRSGYTISVQFHVVLSALLKLHSILLVNPEPIPEDSSDDRWKYFKGCFGALDETYVPVKVALQDKPRYRNHKGNIFVNVLAVCDRHMNYIYVLSGWEGSAADSRVLRDAVTRPYGLSIPEENYYLVDGGYTNGNGFLAPYRGVRYHLQEWEYSNVRSQTPQEFFNLKHARAWNVIERSFGILKARWGILRSNSFYPIKTSNTIIMTCCFLHNFIRTNTSYDPIECQVPEEHVDVPGPTHDDDVPMIDVVETSQAWTNWRDIIAMQIYNDENRLS